MTSNKFHHLPNLLLLQPLLCTMYISMLVSDDTPLSPFWQHQYSQLSVTLLHSPGCYGICYASRPCRADGQAGCQECIPLVPSSPRGPPSAGHVRFFFDKVLRFGPRSAPFVFNCLVDAREWLARQDSILHIHHYLDDFFVANQHQSNVPTISIV